MSSNNLYSTCQTTLPLIHKEVIDRCTTSGTHAMLCTGVGNTSNRVGTSFVMTVINANPAYSAGAGGWIYWCCLPHCTPLLVWIEIVHSVCHSKYLCKYQKTYTQCVTISVFKQINYNYKYICIDFQQYVNIKFNYSELHF